MDLDFDMDSLTEMEDFATGSTASAATTGSTDTPHPTRRAVLGLLSAGALGAGGLFLGGCASPKVAATRQGARRHAWLPWSTVFKGEEKFHELCRRAERENWAAQPIGQRTTTAGRALLGTPYGNYTLEIDDRIESPSVNLHQLDCWTFYETSLAMARLVRSGPRPWQASDLLTLVEMERYRDGQCTGSYISRMHHLEEVFHDNERRGLGRNVTKSLGGVPVRRHVKEMQSAWRSYRYLRSNPSLIPQMAQVERRVSSLPVTYIPKRNVASIESRLQDGDVLAVASNYPGGYTSHVGLAVRDGATCRFMHATSSRDKGRRCVIDTRISTYLNGSSSRMGLIVFRPGEGPMLA